MSEGKVTEANLKNQHRTTLLLNGLELAEQLQLWTISSSSHARLLEAIASSSSTGLEGGTLAQIEGRHRTAGGNTLRAAVLGANDGLLSNLSPLVLGV